MNEHDDTSPEGTSALDEATAGRLRRLSGMPMDLSNLAARVASEVPRPVTVVGTTRWRLPIRMSALAASILLVLGTIGLVISLTARPVVASPAVLAGLYHDSAMMEGHGGMSEGGPVMACCIQRVGGKPVTCMAMDVNGVRVSMAVAEAKHIRVPDEAEVREVDGTVYYVQSSPQINMVMTVRGDAWMCVMGPVPEADLIKLLVRTHGVK